MVIKRDIPTESALMKQILSDQNNASISVKAISLKQVTHLFE